MISKAQIKFIHSLRYKKYRKQNNAFIAEGDKIVSELIHSHHKVEGIFALNDWVGNHANILKKMNIEPVLVNEIDLKKISGLTTPNQVLGVFKIPVTSGHPGDLRKGLTIYLDDLRDPGNMGTIIRTADWFGINRVICSPDCVDVYNPKTIQSAMGSIVRVKVSYASLESIIKEVPGLPVYGAVLTGNPIDKLQMNPISILVIGSESHGISNQTKRLLTQQISIPGRGGAESLNAAIATGILCYAFTQGY
jgi:RNA methyltransferase, TrmH family